MTKEVGLVILICITTLVSLLVVLFMFAASKLDWKNNNFFHHKVSDVSLPANVTKKTVADFVYKKVSGRLVYVSSIGVYLIMIPQGYNDKEVVYKDKVFYNLNDVLNEFKK